MQYYIRSIKTLVLLLLLLMNNNHYAKQEITQSGLISSSNFRPLRTQLNINNLSYWIYANGISGHNYYTDGNGVYFPRGTYGAGVVYSDGFLWGGMVRDGQPVELRVGGTTFNTGLLPGAIISKGIPEDPNGYDARIWRIRQDYKTADLTRDAAEMAEKPLNRITEDEVDAIRDQYRTDWQEWPWQKGAPFYDMDGDQIMDSDEEPGIGGADQVIWFVANDLDESQTQSLYGSPPIGLEVQVTLWGYNRTDGLGNVVFKRFRIIYKGTGNTPSDATIDSLFFAVWSDPDIGDYSNDFVGCDTTLDLMYGYNSGRHDTKFQSFDLKPPAVGYDFFQGPIVYTGMSEDTAIFDLKSKVGYRNLGMIFFNYFAAGSGISDPDLTLYTGTQQWYNLMNGLLPRAGRPFINAQGDPTNRPLAGDPTIPGSGEDVDGVLYPAGDRRMEMITGPLSMAVGDTQEVVIALICGLGENHLSSISAMKFYDRCAQDAYNQRFDLPRSPQSPKLRCTGQDGMVLLNWGWDVARIFATESDQNGYRFEGYNVYQFPHAYSTLDQAEKLATFDLVNDVQIIWDKVIDPETGQMIEKPIQVGNNSGIQRTYTVTRDGFSGRSLVNGRDYYFAVSAYNYLSELQEGSPSLESSPEIKIGRPQEPDPGMGFSYHIGDSVSFEHQGKSDGSIQVTIIDPSQPKGHDYLVKFDSLNGDIVYHLLDLTADQILLENRFDQSPAQVNPIIHGFDIKVLWPENAGINPNRIGVAYGEGSQPSQDKLKGWDFFGKLWIRGNNLGGFALDGGLVNGTDYLGSSVSRDDYVDVELRFTKSRDPSPENGWQNASVYQIDEEGIARFDGVGEAPFQAWDVWNGLQLNVCFFEMDSVLTKRGSLVLSNRQWDLAWNGTEFGQEGGGEVIFIMRSAYMEDPSVIYNDLQYGPTSDVLYVLHALPKEDHTYLESSFTISIFATIENGVDDTFSFSVKTPYYEPDQARRDVEEIHVYPNPYYGSNPNEQTGVDRFVSFNHLPPKATFRIFDLGGNLVRKLKKDDSSQFFRWDLRNHQGLLVASGLYIIHIEMVDLNKTKILKLAVVQANEFLEIY